MRKLRLAVRALTPWFTALVAVAIGVWIVFSSNPFKQCVYSGQHDSAKQQLNDYVTLRDNLLVYRDCLGEFVHANGDAIIAAFTVILAFSTIALWSATRGLVRSAEKNAERQLRAYVFVDSFNAVPFGNDMVVTAVWKNCGATPTRFMTSYISWKTFQGEPPDDYSFPNIGPDGQSIPEGMEILEPMALGPQATHHSTLLRIGMPFFNSAAAGQLRIFIWGWTKYRDVFGGHNITKFCNEITVESADPISHGPPHAVAFIGYRRHTCADEECET